MQDHKNTIAGWVLFAGIVALGATIVSGEVFHGERPEKMGYPIEGVVSRAKAPQPRSRSISRSPTPPRASRCSRSAPPATMPTRAAPTRSAPRFTARWAAVAAKPGFAYSDALKGVGGSWDWDKMSAWLANPEEVRAGQQDDLRRPVNPEERANVIAFLNSRSGSPLPVPAAPAAAAPAEGARGRRSKAARRPRPRPRSAAVRKRRPTRR